jgi:LTR polyprotein gag-polypeptide-like protein
VRGDQVFGERVCATTDGITSTDHSFPDEDFFPDISSLYIDAMADDTGVNLNPNLNANPIPPPAPYVICSYLVQFLLQFLVLALGIDVICLFWLNMICSFILLVYMIRLILALIVMIYYYLFRIKYYGNLLIFSTIQKPDYRQLNSTGLAAATRPPPFDGVNYKRWRTRAVLWLKNLGCYSATLGKPEGDLSPVQEEAFQKVDTMFMGALFNILGDNIVDTYMSFDNGKDAWDALDAKFGVSDAGTELYIMEQFYDYKMTDDRPIVDQAHEIQSLAKELEQFKCNLPDKFVAGGIIAKLPPSWRNFATSLKHKRQEFSVSDLIGSLHVEEKARAKDTRPRGFDGSSSAHVVQKNNFQSHKFKNKNRSDGKGKFDGKKQGRTDYQLQEED